MSENNLKSSLTKSFKNKRLHMFGVFLLLSFIFLVLTKFSKTYNETIVLKLDYVKIPEDVKITIAEPIEVNVEINAVGFRILLYYFKNRTLLLDLEEDVTRMDSTYLYLPKITDKQIKDRIGYEVEILSVAPDSVMIPYGVLDSKIVPIKLNSDISLSPGYDFVDSLRIAPDSVKIIGPNNILKTIDRVETETLVLEEVSSNLTVPVNLLEHNDENIKFSESSTVVAINIDKFTEGTLQIPVTIVNLPSNVKINYFPKSVPVSYYVNLRDFNEVSAEDFVVECDFNSVKDTQRSFFVPNLVQSPEQVKSARIKLDKVEFIFTK